MKLSAPNKHKTNKCSDQKVNQFFRHKNTQKIDD